MSSPRKLLHDERASGFERQLLRAAISDRPPSGARPRLLAALGAAAATATAEGAGAAGTLGPVVAKAWVLKWVGVAVLASATGAAAVHVVSMPEHARVVAAEPATEAATVTATVTVTEAATETVTATVTATETETETEAATETVTEAGSAPARSRPPVPAPVRTLSDETDSLDSARFALRAHASAEALARLDAYAWRFPHGALAPEAAALRVQALLDSGDRPGAEALARALVAASPGTSAARRARTTLNW